MKACICLTIFAAHAAIAATPVLTELKPRGAEIGRPFTLTAVGRNLSEGARVDHHSTRGFHPCGARRNPARC